MSGLAGSASSPLSPKAAHYSSALSAALLHGAWADGHAGKDAKGHEVSWGELVRKWGKHTGGSELYSATVVTPPGGHLMSQGIELR